MPKDWNRGFTKETHPSLKKTSDTMRIRGIDNFKEWREKAKSVGMIKSGYAEFEKTADLAELLGVTLGDGHIYKHDRCESLRIIGNSANPDFANRYASLIEKIFDKPASIIYSKKSNSISITVYEKYISERLGIPTGSRANYDFHLPVWIESSRECQIRFLRGLYEAEGSLIARPGAYTHKFIFSNKNMSLNNTVMDLLSRLGFHPHYSAFKVQVSRKTEVQNLPDLLEFRHYVL